MKKRNWMAFGMAFVMAAGTLAVGAEGLTAKADGEEEVTLRIHTLVPEQANQDAVFEALNEYTKEKIGVTVEYVFHGGSYDDKIQTIIASGEEYDACFTSNWSNSYNNNVAKGAFIDLTELLPKAAPELYETIPEYMWEAATINGGIYAVPNQQIVARQLGALMPADYVEEAGLDISAVHTLTDMTDYAQTIYDTHGAQLGGVNYANTADYCGYEFISDYAAAGAIKMDDESAEVVNFYETDEWMSMLNELSTLAEAGLLDGECAYMAEYSESQRLVKNTSAYFSGTYKPGVEAEESARAGYDCVMPTVDINPYICTSGVTATMYGISTTSKHPEETLKYLELINTDSYAINLLSYGIEGVHYNKVSDNVIETVENSGYSHGQSWALGNVFNTFVLEGQPEDVWEQTKALNDSAKTSPILGFAFDVEPVKLEVTNVSKVVDEYISILGGELPVEETNAEFVEKLKVAGLDTVLEEMQRQIDEFLVSVE